jgi:hypothetical protein
LRGLERAEKAQKCKKAEKAVVMGQPQTLRGIVHTLVSSMPSDLLKPS